MFLNQLWIRCSLFKTGMLCESWVILKLLLYFYLCCFVALLFKDSHVYSLGKACQIHHVDSPLLVGVLKDVPCRLIYYLAFFLILVQLLIWISGITLSEIRALSLNVSVTEVLLISKILLRLSCDFPVKFRNEKFTFS